MKVEFIVNADINDGRQIFIQESEFRKAKNNEEEYNSFAFATNCLFAFYGYPDDFINPDEYEKKLEYAKENTSLPDNPDYKAINEFADFLRFIHRQVAKSLAACHFLCL